jgi:phage terminase Nu1 subunit (DNA packaging protein)
LSHKRKDTRRLVTGKELAVELGVNPRTVSKFMDDGMPVAVRGRGGRPNRYDADACLAWDAARKEIDDGGHIDLLKERALKEKWQAKLAQQLYEVREGKLLEADAVARTWSVEYGAIKTILLSSYTTSADRVLRAATLEGLPGVERELKTIAVAALREISSPDRGGEPPKRKRTRKRAATA